MNGRLFLALFFLFTFHTAESLDVWLTAGDESKLLSYEGTITGSDTEAPDLRIINVDPSVGSQTIVGFGAALTNAASYLLYNSPAKDDLLRVLFSTQGDDAIGIDMVRLVMGGSDFNAVEPYTYDDSTDEDFDLQFFSIEKDLEFIIPLIQQIREINPAVKIVATPWSAPAWMKNPNTLEGGNLKTGTEYLDVLARYFVRFIQEYEAEGVVIDYVIIQNEPLHCVPGYPTMCMSSQEQQELIRDHVGPAFLAAGIPTQIIIYDHNWDDTGYPDGILSDPEAAQYVTGSGWHCYGGDKNAPGEIRDKFPDKEIYFTECSGGEWDTNFGSVLGWNVQNLFIGQTRVGAKGVLLWNMALDDQHGPRVGVTGGCADCRGVMTLNEGSSDYTLSPEYYAIGQFSKFVRQGATFVDATTFPDDLETAAFKNPDGSVVVTVLNTSWDEIKSFQIQLNGLYYVFNDIPPRSVASFVNQP